MRPRVAKLWDCPEEEVSFEDGAFLHGKGGHDPMTVKELAPKLSMTGGPVQGQASVQPKHVGASFAVDIGDVEVDDIHRGGGTDDGGRRARRLVAGEPVRG